MAENGDMKAHEHTYSSVMNLLKWTTVGALLITLLVMILIAS